MQDGFADTVATLQKHGAGSNGWEGVPNEAWVETGFGWAGTEAGPQHPSAIFAGPAGHRVAHL